MTSFLRIALAIIRPEKALTSNALCLGQIKLKNNQIIN